MDDGEEQGSKKRTQGQREDKKDQSRASEGIQQQEQPRDRTRIQSNKRSQERYKCGVHPTKMKEVCGIKE